MREHRSTASWVKKVGEGQEVAVFRQKAQISAG